jgi:L-fuculose-phosphate aldolase
LVAIARETVRAGLNRGSSGNLSVRDGAGFLITPSGRPYERLQAGDMVFFEDCSSPDPRVAGGRPSSEWRIHRDVYAARPDAEAILHAHPVHCTALACLNRPLPAFHYMVAVAGGRDIRCAAYATFGTQALSDSSLEALQDRRACLMANHGLLCLGRDLEQALSLAVEIEDLARSYLACLAVGEPRILDDAEMDRVLEKFRDYGPPR